MSGIEAIFKAIHDLLPYVVAIAGSILLAALHRKNEALQKSHLELAEKVDEIQNTKAQANIESLEEKVSFDDEARIAAEKALSNLSPASSGESSFRK